MYNSDGSGRDRRGSDRNTIQKLTTDCLRRECVGVRKKKAVPGERKDSELKRKRRK